MMKKLFIVGTPIGNFEDITLRAINTLKTVDVIACEDTRVTIKLLHHFGINDKKLISYHNFNEQHSAHGIIDLVQKSGKSVALVTDAGMPIISDPGFLLIDLAKKANISFEVIPGVSALTTAFCASGLGHEFTFLGFGKPKKQQLINQIESLVPGTYIFFSAPHKIEFLLDVIEQKIEHHQIFVGREMTKKFETFYYGKAQEVKKQLQGSFMGEFTLVLKIEKTKKIKINKYQNNQKIK